MHPDVPDDAINLDDRIAALLSEYFERRQAGENLSADQFASQHPHLAAELWPHLRGLSLVEQARSRASGISAESAPEDGRLPQIKGYRLIEEIGRGGMGVVYRALQISTKRIVALKVMLGGPFASPASTRRFEREVELAARLQHPSIVGILESGEASGQRYYAMDYVAGVRLNRHLSVASADVSKMLRLFVQICDAVEYAHRHGVVHRDLKPSNVLIDEAGDPHVLDFGLAKALDHADSPESASTCVSLPGQVLGTLFYISPEQAAGAPADVDHRTDVYALGVMLYEALTGALPFGTTGRPSEIIRRILEAAPKPPSSLSKTVKPELEIIVLKALAREKQRRYQSAADLADDLRRYLAGEPIRAQRPSSLYVLRKKLIKHRLAAGAAAVVLMLAIAAVVSTAWARQREWARARAAAVVAQRALEWHGPTQALATAGTEYRRHPDLPEACLVLAQAQYGSLETRSHAIRFLEAELRRNPDAWHCRELLGEIYRAAGDTERAEMLLAEAERAFPDTTEGWYLRSFATLDRERAARCAEEAVRRQPDHKLAWNRLTHLRLQAGDLEGAYQAAERLIQLGESPADWMLFKGHILARQGKLDAAVQQYTQLIALKPTSADAYRVRAHVYRRLARYAESVTDYGKALELDGPRTANVWDYYQRATPLWILGRKDEAAEDYRRVRVLLGRPFYSDARAFLILREQGRPAEAEAVLRAALHEVQEEWLRQVLRCLDGQFAPADLIADARSRNDREHVCEACYYAGEIYLLAGRTAEACRWFEQAVQTGVQYDLQSFPMTPMNEYELAQWRLEALCPDENPASQGESTSDPSPNLAAAESPWRPGAPGQRQAPDSQPKNP
jgi:tetratricopeptide (TPR) repeat protein